MSLEEKWGKERAAKGEERSEKGEEENTENFMEQ